jgi:hypothetical protein
VAIHLAEAMFRKFSRFSRQSRYQAALLKLPLFKGRFTKTSPSGIELVSTVFPRTPKLAKGPTLTALIERGRGWPWNGYELVKMKKDEAGTTVQIDHNDYSALKACMGSVDAARRAGINPATPAATVSATTAPAITHTS